MDALGGEDDTGGGGALLAAAILAKRSMLGSLTTAQRYLRPDIHKITAAGTALSAHLTMLRAPRTLPATPALTR